MLNARQLGLLIRLTRSHLIARRYFIVNGFDGALTMLGILMGFHVSENVAITTIISAALGAAIALGISGLSSAYISESAEMKNQLRELEEAMAADLGESAHGQAARLVPVIVAIANGAAPLLVSLIITSPLLLAHWQPEWVGQPLEIATMTAFVAIFVLGVILGSISGTFWLWAGLKTLLIALVTGLLIYLINPI